MATYPADSFGFIPDDLLVSIFGRLSGKELLKCKCVSKEWCRIISHVCVPPLSAETPVSGLYYRIAFDNNMPHVGNYSSQEDKDNLQNLMAECDSIHYIESSPLIPELDPSGVKHSPSADFAGMSFASGLPFNLHGPDFLDCCNGLILVVQRPKPQFYVCNPAIRQCVAIPRPPPSLRLCSLYASLAFDPSESIYYRVVISSLTTSPQCLHVFYSETGEWITHEVELELPTSAKCFQLVRHSVYLKGVVYRLSMLYKILCFDLKSLKPHVMNCPSRKSQPTYPEIGKNQPPPGCIGVSNGSLSYVSSEDGYICVWLLDRHNEYNGWSLKYEICFDYLWKFVSKRCLRARLVWLRCCGFHPTSDILFFFSVSWLWRYDVRSCSLERVRTFTIRKVSCGLFFPVFLHKDTFVTLKNWCRGTTSVIDKYEDVLDTGFYIEQ